MDAQDIKRLKERQDHTDKTLQIICFFVAAFIAFLIFR
jgi:hypothetical protein